MKFGKRDIKVLIMIVLSAFGYSIAMKAFVEAGSLFPGGFAGLSRLFSTCLNEFLGINISFSIIYLLLNIFPTILVYRYVGKKFTIYSVLQYSLTSIFTSILPSFPLTKDLLLIAVFGGILHGFSISIALRSGASSGGTDFLAIFFANKYNKSTWNYVMGANAIVLLTVGVLFSWEQALYSIIYQFCNTQVVSALHNRYKLDTLYIVTKKPEEVSSAILKTCRHGITRMNGEGMYSHSDVSLLMMTANEYQIEAIVAAVRGIDDKAFITVNKTEKIIGNYYQVPLD